MSQHMKIRYHNCFKATSEGSDKPIINEPRHEISNNVVCVTSKGSDQPAHTGRLIRAFANRLNIP